MPTLLQQEAFPQFIQEDSPKATIIEDATFSTTANVSLTNGSDTLLSKFLANYHELQSYL
jgi:hypothetical protein